ncbi:hypothetical protein EK904_014830, partial [Melospiza melodia maxima]
MCFREEKDALQSNSPVSFTAVTQELTFSGLIVKFQFFLLLLVVVMPLAAGQLTPQQEGSMGSSFPSGMACSGSASKQNVLIPVIPCQEARAVQCFCAAPSAPGASGKMAPTRALGDWCVFVLALSTVSQMPRMGVGKPAVARVCVQTDSLETNGFSFEQSQLMNVKCFGLCPLRWTWMCCARELEGRGAAPLPLGAGRAHRDVRLERSQDLNSKMRELPKGKRAAVWGKKEQSLGLCSCTCSLCSPGWEHGGFLLQQRQFQEHPIWTLGWRVPHGHFPTPLVALPLATLPDGCLAVLEPAQLRQPLQPCVHSWRLNAVCGFVCFCVTRFCPQPLPGSG